MKMAQIVVAYEFFDAEDKKMLAAHDRKLAFDVWKITEMAMAELKRLEPDPAARRQVIADARRLHMREMARMEREEALLNPVKP